MGKIEATAASSAGSAGHAAVGCFGERGMAHCPGHPHPMPIAAGLFGLVSGCVPRPSNDGALRGRMMTAA